MLLLTCPCCGVDRRGDRVRARRRGASEAEGPGPGTTRSRLPLRRAQPPRRAFRALAPRLRLRQVVPRRPLHRDAGGLRQPIRRRSRRRPRSSSPRSARGGRTGVAAVSARLAEGGRLIDRAGRWSSPGTAGRLQGYAGDTLASALLANGVTLVGRIFKYHRPRGIVASGVEEPNALVGLGAGRRLRAERARDHDAAPSGLEARSQNHWPSLEFDVGARRARGSRALLPAGFYYKTFIHPRAAWKHLFEPLIRRSAGLGAGAGAPADPDTLRQSTPMSTCWSSAAGSPGWPRPRGAARAARGCCWSSRPGIGAAGRWSTAPAIDGRRRRRTGSRRRWLSSTRCRTSRAAPRTTALGRLRPRLRAGGGAAGERARARRLWRIRARRIVIGDRGDRAAAGLRRQRPCRA